MNELNEYIGTLIKELRQSRNLSQKKIADVFNCDKSLISYWENGKRQMNVTDLFVFFEAIEASVEVKSAFFEKLVRFTTR